MEKCFFHCICFKSGVLLEKTDSFQYLVLRDGNVLRWWSTRAVSLGSEEVCHCQASRELRAGNTSTFYSSSPFENLSRKPTVLVAEMSKQSISTFLKIFLFLFDWHSVLVLMNEASAKSEGGKTEREREREIFNKQSKEASYNIISLASF